MGLIRALIGAIRHGLEEHRAKQQQERDVEEDRARRAEQDNASEQVYHAQGMQQQQQPYQQQATRTAVSPGVGSSTITKPPSAAAAYVEGTPTSTREYDNKYSLYEFKGQFVGPPVHGLFSKLIHAMSTSCNAPLRRAISVKVLFRISFSVFLAGVILVGLAGGGVFPATVAEQKALGVFNVTIVKYVLYTVAGILGMYAVKTGRGAMKRREAALSLDVALVGILVSVLIVLATMGMTAWLTYKTVHNPYYTTHWWEYLIIAIVFVQRLIYIFYSWGAVSTLAEVKEDIEKLQFTKV